jgi:hypothetical protein
MTGDGYDSLRRVLHDAAEQAISGKGHQRHATGSRDFEEQVSAWIQRERFDYARGQAVKKLHESLRMEPEAAIREIRGAINLCAVAILELEECSERKI